MDTYNVILKPYVGCKRLQYKGQVLNVSDQNVSGFRPGDVHNRLPSGLRLEGIQTQKLSMVPELIISVRGSIE